MFYNCYDECYDDYDDYCMCTIQFTLIMIIMTMMVLVLGEFTMNK